MCPHLADSVDTFGSTVRRLRHSGVMALRPMDDLETPGFACSHCLVWALAWGSGLTWLTWKNQWIPHGFFFGGKYQEVSSISVIPISTKILHIL